MVYWSRVVKPFQLDGLMKKYLSRKYSMVMLSSLSVVGITCVMSTPPEPPPEPLRRIDLSDPQYAPTISTSQWFPRDTEHDRQMTRPDEFHKEFYKMYPAKE